MKNSLNLLIPWLIDINQGTVLHWFGIHEKDYIAFSPLGIDPLQIESARAFSLETLQLLLHGFWLELQSGICVADIDRTIIIISIVRFFILSYRYNPLTSVVITASSLAAGFLWYNRFLNLIMLYERGLYQLDYTFKLAVDSGQIKSIIVGTVRSINYKIRLTNPVGVLMYAIGNGSIKNGYRIDPISMMVTKNDPNIFYAPYIESAYYLVYRRIIPYTIRVIKLFHRQFSSIIQYTVITRLNKKYCPYLLRWHWTLFIIIASTDRVFSCLYNRIQYYLIFHLVPEIIDTRNLEITTGYVSYRRIQFLVTESVFLNSFSTYIIFASLSFTLFLLLHAICGQYVFLPILTENVELHIGPRQKNSIYSGGLTAWQDRKEKRSNKYWYGWFGRGTTNQKDPLPTFKRFIANIIKRFYRKIKKIIKKTLRRLF